MRLILRFICRWLSVDNGQAELAHDIRHVTKEGILCYDVWARFVEGAAHQKLAAGRMGEAEMGFYGLESPIWKAWEHSQPPMLFSVLGSKRVKIGPRRRTVDLPVFVALHRHEY